MPASLLHILPVDPAKYQYRQNPTETQGGAGERREEKEKEKKRREGGRGGEGRGRGGGGGREGKGKRGGGGGWWLNDTATTEIYTRSLLDALPIWKKGSTSLPRLASRATRLW